MPANITASILPDHKYPLTFLILSFSHWQNLQLPSFTASFHFQMSLFFLRPHCPCSCMFYEWFRQLPLLCTSMEAVLWEQKLEGDGSFQFQFFSSQNRSELHLQQQISSATSNFCKRDIILKNMKISSKFLSTWTCFFSPFNMSASE